MAKGTGHGTGPMIPRDLHAILLDSKHRKQHRKALRLSKQRSKVERHGKPQLPGGELR